MGLPSYVIRIATIGSVAFYFVAAGLHGEFSAIALTFFQYMFMLPTYTNIFAIYSFCNIHDISWGTKVGRDRDLGMILLYSSQTSCSALKQASSFHTRTHATYCAFVVVLVK